MRLELVNQFLECLFADVIVFLDSPMEQSLNPEVYFTATSFLVCSTVTIFFVLARMVEGSSRVRACNVLASIMQVRLQYNSLRYRRRLIRFAVQLFF